MIKKTFLMGMILSGMAVNAFAYTAEFSISNLTSSPLVANVLVPKTNESLQQIIEAKGDITLPVQKPSMWNNVIIKIKTVDGKASILNETTDCNRGFYSIQKDTKTHEFVVLENCTA